MILFENVNINISSNVLILDLKEKSLFKTEIKKTTSISNTWNWTKSRVWFLLYMKCDAWNQSIKKNNIWNLINESIV